MKKCQWTIVLLTVLFPALLIAQTDTVDVLDFFTPGGGEGSLNTAVSAKINAGTLSNTVFRLKPYGLYVLSATITVPAGTRLTIVAPDPGNTQETAPPMICWTPASGVSTTFNFDCFGDIYMKNIWILYATTNTDGVGTQVGSALEIDEDTTDHVNKGVFQNVIFDYAPISNGGGSVTVSASHARLTFENCYFRNATDTHFRYYGRAVSFPFGTSGWHIDSLSFVNTTFANMGYVYMQEGAEYADYVKFNHCTFLNTIQFSLESGWWHWLSVTNSIFVNMFMFGHLPGTGNTADADNSTPNGGTVNIDSIGTTNFNFAVPFTESQRHILFANNSYYMDQWLREYMAPRSASNPTGGNPYSDTASYANIPQPQPIMSAKTMRFFNDKTVWPYISMKSVYDSTNPGFLIPPTNIVGIKSFLLRKWTDNSDTTWAFDPHSDVNQVWPVNEQIEVLKRDAEDRWDGRISTRRFVPMVEELSDHLLGLESPGRGGGPDHYRLAHEWRNRSGRESGWPPTRLCAEPELSEPIQPVNQNQLRNPPERSCHIESLQRAGDGSGNALLGHPGCRETRGNV